MAKIEMDVSEWQLMKDKETLLEYALKREEMQSLKIETLKQEKIDALKLNEKSVTIIEETHSIDTISVSRPVEDIMKRLRQLFDYERESSNGFDRSFPFDHQLRDEVERIQNLFFVTTRNIMNQDGKITKSVTHKGLDQVKKEIADKYSKKMSKEHKLEQKEATRIFKQHNKIMTEIEEGKHDLKIASGLISDLENDVRTLGNTIRKDNNRHKEDISNTVPSIIVNRTRRILDNLNWFNQRYALKQLKNIWKKS